VIEAFHPFPAIALDAPLGIMLPMALPGKGFGSRAKDTVLRHLFVGMPFVLSPDADGSISRFNGLCDPLSGIVAAKVVWRLLSVVKFDTGQSTPTSRRRLCTNAIC